MTSLVAVDIGNSSIKLGWFPSEESRQLLPDSRVQNLHVGQLDSPLWEKFCEMIDDTAHWVVASVNPDACEKLKTAISITSPDAFITVLQNSMLPIESDIQAVEQVGTDRLLAALAVTAIAPHSKPAIIIDSGTAVTVDVISPHGTFAGGVIMPGSALIARALNEGTAQLPQVVLDQNNPPSPIGKNTQEAISAGIFWGLVGSINELVRQQRLLLGHSTPVYVSGGDSWIASHLEFECQSVSNLCLLGIAAAVEAGLQL